MAVEDRDEEGRTAIVSILREVRLGFSPSHQGLLSKSVSLGVQDRGRRCSWLVRHGRLVSASHILRAVDDTSEI